MDSVYVIRSADGPHKIGRSKNPAGRLAKFQTVSPAPLDLAHHVPHADVKALERCVHELLADNHLHGEWFKVTTEQAIRAVSLAEYMIADGWKPSSKHIPTGKPVGRPPGRERPNKVIAYLSDDELAAVDETRGEESRSSFIRSAILDAAWNEPD